MSYLSLFCAPKKAGEADGFTCFSQISECFNSLADYYWYATTIDLIFNLEPTITGCSLPGLIGGACIAAYTAATSSYAHRILNINNQHPTEEMQLLCDTRVKKPRGILAYRAIITGDFLAHTMDFLAMPTLIFEGVSHFSRTPKLIARAALFIFAAASAYPSNRTCSHQLLRV